MRISRRAALAGIASISNTGGAGAALAAVGYPASISPGAPAADVDSELIQLGLNLMEAWAAELAAEAPATPFETVKAAVRSSSAIVRRIQVINATTVAGLQVKAMAVRWACSGDLLSDDHHTTDVRLACSIVEDLLQMGDRP